MSSQSKTSDSRWIYDVFLSLDTWDMFTSRLYNSLINAGVNVYMDDEELTKGDQISTSQIQAIEASRISVFVFSKSYAVSTRCLQELEKIMDCRRTIGQLVMPVFYDVDPSDVHNMRGEFGEAFEDLTKTISEDKVNVWKAVLHEATNILGFDPLDSCSRMPFGFRKFPQVLTSLLRARLNESEDIKLIVKNVKDFLYNAILLDAKHLVGVQSRVQDVMKLIKSQQSNDVLFLGLWGMVGSGKTTIAKAIYTQTLCDFEGYCFLEDVGERWKKGDQLYLQESLLSHIYKTKRLRIHDLKFGKFILHQSLHHKRILVILDNVHQGDQLKALCGSREWFGPGSIIIITTRDRRILEWLEVDHIYETELMNMNESVELFSRHALRQASPKGDFVELSRQVAEYCGGLPLALKIIGSSLYGKSEDAWRSELDKLKRIPNAKLFSKLKVSFDSLTSHAEKKIFREIACFFIGTNRSEVIRKLNGYKLPAEFVVRVLIDVSLLTVDNKNRLAMHALVEQMGREIIRKSRDLNQPKIFDVLLSFRGEDTRATFTSHLYASLQNAGIYVFRDNNEIQRGDTVSITLLEAIGKSRICIIVLSRNYANSSWCIQELENIMESRHNLGLVVVPVFYDVDPSEVRNQKGMFGRAFEDLLQRFSVNEDKEKSWRDALLEVGGIAGFVVLNSRNENEEIVKIVEHVTRLLDCKDLFVANHPVGVESRVQHVLQLLENQPSERPLMLGIWGMGGMGKTTIAKAAYNKMRHEFEGRCFLLDVREVWKQDNGGVRLQEQLLSSICKTTKEKIDNIESGKLVLEKRLKPRRILVVLDDVDKSEQLNALAGSHEWFGPRSVIIITTRDAHLLRLLSVDKLYRMEKMNDKECIERFSWHAFKEPCPKQNFALLSRKVISYCGKLPLALEALGSHLFNRGELEWESVLKKLVTIGSIPDEQVHEKLKISFDGLIDEYQKIFLDVAFFFIGMERNDVIDILNGCEYSAEIGVTVLIERSLVTVDTKNKLRMHDLLQVMGREIVRERPPKAPEDRTRLWHHDEVLGVLSKCMGTKAIEGLALKFPTASKNTPTLKTKAFKHMTRLRLLQLAGVQLDGDFKHLSTDLRWLCWHGLSSTYAPENLHQGNLVAIDFKYSSIKLVWKKGQLMDKLKILNLGHSQHLTQTPDFSCLPNLKKLILKDCLNLSSISHSIGHLKKILVINLKGCTSLRVLPRSIYSLKSLKTLILSGCSKIERLEEDLERMESLTTLMADNTAITQVPHSIVRLKSIAYISLCGFEGLSRNVFPSIIWSSSPTNTLLPQMPTFVNLPYLVSLMTPNSGFHGTPSPECDSQLQTTRDVDMDNSALLDYCSQHDISGLRKFILIQMGMSCPHTEILREAISQKLRSSCHGECLVPGDKNTEWLTFNGEGSSVTFQVSQANGDKLKSVMLCIVYSSSSAMIASEGLILKKVKIKNYTKTTAQVYEGDMLTSFAGEDWQSVISSLEPGDQVQIAVVLGHGLIVLNTAAYLIYHDQKMEGHTRGDVMDCGVNDDVVADENENASTVDHMVVDEINVTLKSAPKKRGKNIAASEGSFEPSKIPKIKPEKKKSCKASHEDSTRSKGDLIKVLNDDEPLLAKDSLVDLKPNITPDASYKGNNDDSSEVSSLKIPSEEAFFHINIEGFSPELMLDDTAALPDEGVDEDDLFAQLDNMFTISPSSKTSSAGFNSSTVEPSLGILSECIAFMEGKDLDTLFGDVDSNKEFFDKLAKVGEIASQLPPHLKDIATKVMRFFKDTNEKYSVAQAAISRHQRLLNKMTSLQQEVEKAKLKRANMIKASSQIKARLTDAKAKRAELEAQLKEVVEKESKLLVYQKTSDDAFALLKRDMSVKLEEGKRVLQELQTLEQSAQEAKKTKEVLVKDLESAQQLVKIVEP